MTPNLKKILGLAGGVILASGVAHAATLSNGGTICEGPKSLLSAAQKSACEASDGFFGDGPQAPAGPTVTLAFSESGHGIINGGIRGKNDTQFNDVFQLDGDGLYNVTLTALSYYGDPNPAEDDFDATWYLGGSAIGTIGNIAGVDGETLTVTGINLTNATEFKLVAAGGEVANNSVMRYEVKIEAVPLPAGMVLLLSGLGGLAIARRRKTS